MGASRALDGLEVEMTGSVDIDRSNLELEEIFEYPMLILRRSASSSRPPSPYARVWRGERYEVWQRPPQPKGPVLHHMALGEEGVAAAFPNCSQVVGLGLLALANQLGYPAQDIRLIGVAPDGLTLTVGPDEARGLCGSRWDWIEAVGLSS